MNDDDEGEDENEEGVDDDGDVSYVSDEGESLLCRLRPISDFVYFKRFEKIYAPYFISFDILKAGYPSANAGFQRGPPFTSSTKL